MPIKSFKACCKMVDLILQIKMGLIAAGHGADRLQELAAQHLQAHLDVYGDSYIRPKHHWMQDFPAQVLRDGLVLDAFVVERTHLDVKRVAETVQNTTRFDQSVLASLLTVTVQNVKDVSWDGGLEGRTGNLPGEPSVFVADRLRMWGTTISVGDVVLADSLVAVVAACAQQHGHLFLMVSPLTELQHITEMCSTYRTEASLKVWSAADVCLALAWRDRPGGSIMVIRR